MKSQLEESYSNYIQQKLERQHQNASARIRWFMYACIGLLVMLVSIFVLYRRNKRKKQHLETQIKKEQYAHEMKQKALLGRLKSTNEALRKQIIETDDLAKKADIERQQVEWSSIDDFLNESICQEILEALNDKQIKREAKSGDYPELHLNDAQLHNYSVAVEKHFSGFEKKLTSLYPKISRNAMNQCLLYLLNLDDIQIAALLSYDYSTVKRRSSKLKIVFNTEKELRQFIREFVL